MTFLDTIAGLNYTLLILKEIYYLNLELKMWKEMWIGKLQLLNKPPKINTRLFLQ